jgi:hypothetical protein
MIFDSARESKVLNATITLDRKLPLGGKLAFTSERMGQ